MNQFMMNSLASTTNHQTWPTAAALVFMPLARSYHRSIKYDWSKK